MKKEQNPTAEQIANWKKEYGEVYVLSSEKGDVYLSKPTRQVYGLYFTKVVKQDVLGAAEVVFANCWLHGDESLKNDNGFKLGLLDEMETLIQKVKVEVKKI